MKVVAITRPGEAEVLEIQERAVPIISSNEVLIHVKAAGVNRPDIFQRKGNYPAPSGVANDIPGLEVSGVICEVGDDVVSFQIGQAVMALVAGGGYAEYVAVDAGSCLLIPENVSFEEAAGMPETLFTVWHNVFQRGRLGFGESLLVHGGAGGIGLTAIQLAKLFGNKVYTTVGSEKKKQFVEDLGVSKAFDYNIEDFEEYLGNNSVDVVLDCIGGDYFNKNINVLNLDGRLVQINAMAGAKVSLNLIKLMQKRIYLTGSTLRNRSNTFKSDIAKELNIHVLPFIANGSYKTIIEKVFSIDDAVKAHKLMESRDFIGKIILVF